MTVSSIFSDPILFFFLSLLLAYSVVEAARLYFWLSKPLLAKIRSFVERTENGYIPKKETVEGSIGRIWTRYRRTFVESEEKTEEEAADHFTEDALVGGALNLRYWKAVPNLLVGIGILGTFVGLTVGISDFETQSVDTVRASIEDLLSGMATAFVSSIVGMALSLVFNGLEKWRFGQINQAIRQLCGELDARYLMKEADRRALRRQEQREVLTDVFAYEDEGHQILPAHMFRDLRQEAREQTQMLKSFNTELADGIKISTMTIEQLGSELGEAFQLAMKQRLTPTIEKVQDAVEKLRNEKAASNEDMVQNVVDRLETTLEDISGQFQESLSGGALDQLEKTADTVGEMGELLASFQSDFASMSEDLKESVETMAEKTGEEAHAATKRMRQESEGAARTMRSEMEKATESVGEEIESLQNNSAELLRRQQSSAEAVQSLLDEGGDVAGRLKEAADTLKDTLRRFQQMAETLEETANKTRKTGVALESSAAQLQDHQQEWLNAEKETLTELESALSDIQELSSTYVQQFEGIREGLKEIFGEIEDGLSSYQNTTRESINNYLSDFAENLETATSALHGSVTALDESFEELHEILDKMKNGQR
jgi:methyl-accepting chemotaxis protein